MARLFVAVRPPDEILDTVAGLARPAVSGMRWTSREQWHVTLRFMGNVDDPTTVMEALSAVDAPAADAVLGPAVTRFGQRVLHVPVQGLDTLAAAVVDVTRLIGRPPEDRPFTGHITLGRVARAARVDLRELEGQAVAGRWRAGSVELFESRLSRAGATYTVVGAQPLRPDA